MHSAAITSQRTLYTWGCNTYGQLGLGAGHPPTPSQESSLPFPCLVQYSEGNGEGLVMPLTVFRVSCGGCHTVAIHSNQIDVYAWGRCMYAYVCDFPCAANATLTSIIIPMYICIAMCNCMCMYVHVYVHVCVYVCM
ncbi:hypothetical protein EON63_19065 [archaeon]|nr:MAG: hypothetical protein EON63_19065 [archaeon]